MEAAGILVALLAVLGSDELSNRWSECLNDANSDSCKCRTCIGWLKVKEAAIKLEEAQEMLR